MDLTSSIALKKTSRYTPVAIFLHWVIALFVISMVALGWYMVSIEDNPGSGIYFNLHKSFGIILAVLIVVRIVWRFGHKPPPLPGSLAKWQAISSRTTHFLLYCAIVLMPTVGILGAMFSKGGLAFFGLEFPRVFAPDRAIAEQFFAAHGVIAWIILALVLVHSLAGLKHLLIDKNKVFERMWFGTGEHLQ